ncbi:MAG TPA: benzoate-CoA ligase family protein [Pyrinomonadaceae bacterium]|jgi:benzoate-CoA ligase|nr:benzoate-CoA ligase family protein [Pyrinomonadaceae bacterium]
METVGLAERIFLPERVRRVAILYEHREISYADLQEAVSHAADMLAGIGISQGDRVAILLADSPEFIALFIAIISLGAIAVPINLALRRDDQLFILNDCGARAAVVEASVVNGLFANGLMPVSLVNLIVVQRDSDGSIREVGDVKLQMFDDRTAPANRVIADHRPADTNADAFILYTSGSTGEPKGAVHSQGDIFYTNETYCREVLNLRDSDRLFSSSRLPFAYGLGNAFTFPLLNGCTAILCREKPTAEVIARIFDEYRPTIFFGVPVVYRMLLEPHQAGVRVRASVGRSAGNGPTEVGALKTGSLRLCISAGEALPAALGQEWQDMFDVQVLDGIGSTEMLHMWMSNHDGDVRYGSSGKLLHGYEARLIDHEDTAVAKGEVGNLWIRGGSAASRYWQRPDISAATFVDGWTRTGDLYRQDADGFWWHMGRSDDCFKPTGQWVSPVEVEGVLLKSEHIRAAAVVEGFDKDGLSCVCAFIVRSDDDEIAKVEKSLRDLCESSLPRFKQPRRYIFIDELPYTATGKVQRFKLREQLRAEKTGQ